MTTQLDPNLQTGGALSQLPSFPNPTFAGTELFEVAVALFANYSISASALAFALGGSDYVNTIVTSGASYAVPTNVSRVLFNKTVGSATAVTFASSSGYARPVLIRDLKGDADVNNITITFSGGQLCDGLASVVIANPYGGFIFNPLANGWYLGAF